jgi:hypothetical protein
VTGRIVKAAAPPGIAIHDHLIISMGGHASLRDIGRFPLGPTTGAASVLPFCTRQTALYKEDC